LKPACAQFEIQRALSWSFMQKVVLCMNPISLNDNTKLSLITKKAFVIIEA
jgi:hypothetical protein